MSTVRGCQNNTSTTTRKCYRNLTDDEFVYDGETYYIRTIFIAGTRLQLSLALSPDRNAAHVALPRTLRAEGTLYVGERSFRLSESTIGSNTIFWDNPGFSWSINQQVQLSLTWLDEEKRVRELRKGASRSGVCGESTTNSALNDVAGDTPGLWHCHGDVYHYHADWNKAHTPHIATEDLRPTGDTPASPPATAPASWYLAPQKSGHQPVRAEGFSNWHSHSDGRFHRHAGGH